MLGPRFHWLVVRILCNIQNMIYNTEQVLYNTLNWTHTIHIYCMVVLVFVVRPLSSSDMQLKLFSFSTDICAGFHTIYCMFINFPFWPEMAKMMILSDCYQVNLMMDHNPAQLKIGFINFTAISEYYLLFLDIFFFPPLTFKLEIVLRSGDCESFTISAWFVMKVSCCQPPASASQSYHMETSLHLHTMRTSY